MAGLRFQFAEIIREIKALRTIAQSFLDQGTAWSLDTLESGFNSAWSASDKAISLELSPLKTIVSEGHYEAGRRQGGPHVRAVITGIWEVRPLGQRARKERARQKRQLEFCGKASTKVEIFGAQDENMEDRLAMWRIELGAEDAPGSGGGARLALEFWSKMARSLLPRSSPRRCAHAIYTVPQYTNLRSGRTKSTTRYAGIGPSQAACACASLALRIC